MFFPSAPSPSAVSRGRLCACLYACLYVCLMQLSPPWECTTDISEMQKEKKIEQIQRCKKRCKLSPHLSPHRPKGRKSRYQGMSGSLCLVSCLASRASLPLASVPRRPSRVYLMDGKPVLTYYCNQCLRLKRLDGQSHILAYGLCRSRGWTHRVRQA